MIATAHCQHCSGLFEYDGMSRTEFCPHCGKESAVAKAAPAPAPAAALAVAKRLVPCPDCGQTKSTRALWCPGCGSLGLSLFRFILNIYGTICLVSVVLFVVGWIVLQIISRI